MILPVKHFRHTMGGAPTLNGLAGAMIALLDACLVTGFGLKALDSLVVTDGIATASVSSSHGFTPDAVLRLVIADLPALSGEHRVLTRTLTTFTFAAPGIANGVIGGSMEARLAPAGWDKVFSTGTSFAAYRSPNIEGARMFLFVDDAGTTTCRVVGYESMSDIDTGNNPFPTPAQMAGGLYWHKASAADATARGWTLFADDRRFYFSASAHASANLEGGLLHGFGDFASLKAGDAWACFISGHTASAPTGTAALTSSLHYVRNSDNTAAGLFVPRAFTGVASPQPMSLGGLGFPAPDGYSGAHGTVYPNGPNNGLLVNRRVLTETSDNVRGILPGLYDVPQVCHGWFAGGQHLDGQGELAGRRLAVVKGGNGANSNASAMMSLIDITGPWS